MRLLNKSIYALSLGAMIGLWSCASEEVLPVDQPESGKPITLTITVDRGGATTRTLLEDDGKGGLSSVWTWEDESVSKGKDHLLLVDKSGNVQATLYLQAGEGTSKGIFYGIIPNYKEDEVYNLWYTLQDVRSNVSGSWTLSMKLGRQNYFSLEDLSKAEVMSSNNDDKLGGYKIEVVNGEGHIVEDVKMQSRLAMAHFSLDGLPENEKGTLYIYNADGNGKTPVEVAFQAGVKFSPDGTIKYTTTQNNITYDKITVENAEAGKDVYVALIPGAWRLGFTFVAENGTEYTYERALSTDIQAGVYYTDGNGGAIPVSFTEVKQEIDYKVILKNEDGSVYKEIPAPSKEDTQTVELPDAPEKEDHEFVGWKDEDMEEDPEAPVVKDQWELTKDKPQVTLIPIYERNKFDFVFTYQPNCEGLNPKNFSKIGSKSSTWTHTVRDYDSSDINFTWDGHEIIEWNTKSDGSGDSYKPGYKFEFSYPDITTFTVYAIWKKNDSSGTITAPGSEGSDY